MTRNELLLILFGCFFFLVGGMVIQVPLYEQPPLFAEERNSLGLETFFSPKTELVWERGRGCL